MLAAVAHGFAEPGTLTVEERPDPIAGPGQLLISVHAIGLNPADVYQVRGQFQTPPPAFPFIPGFEVAGAVAAIGDGVTGWSIGNRVVAATIYGAYAEQIVVHASAAARVPDAIDLSTAAALPVAFGTAAFALDTRAVVQSGESIAVLGAAGSVGSATVELAKARGLTVYGSASDQFTLRVQPDAIYSHHSGNVADQLFALTGGQGVDVVIDMVGGTAGADALRALRWSGRLVIVGAASGDLQPIAPFDLLAGNKAVLGLDFATYIVREPSAVAHVIGSVMADMVVGKLRPQRPLRRPLAQAGTALADVAGFRVAKTVLVTAAGDVLGGRT